MRYYEDREKITYDEAEEYVVRFIEENRERRSRVTAAQVAREVGIEESRHNLVRLSAELEDRLPIARPARAKATQYRIP